MGNIIPHKSRTDRHMGSSNFVAMLVTWPTMHCNCSRSEVKVTWRNSRQKRYNSAVYARINFKLGGNYQRGGRLINQELIGVGSSKLVARLVTWPAMHSYCSRSKVKVTKSRDVSADKNAITRQCMVISTSNLVGIIDVGDDACGKLSRSVGQTNRK